MLDFATAENRDLTQHESDRFDTLSRSTDTLDARIDELQETTRRNASADRKRAPYEQALNNYGQVGGLRNEYSGADMNPTDVELREWIQGRSSQRAIAVNLPETRDLTVGSVAAGGATVPTGFANRLHEHMIETAAIRQTNVTVLRTESGEDINVPKTTAHGTAGIVAEGAAISENDPTFATITLQAFKYGVVTQVSTELKHHRGVVLN